MHSRPWIEAGRNAAVSGVVRETDPASTKKPRGITAGLVSFAVCGFAPGKVVVEELAARRVEIDA